MRVRRAQTTMRVERASEDGTAAAGAGGEDWGVGARGWEWTVPTFAFLLCHPETLPARQHV